MTRIGIAGDWHSDATSAIGMLKLLHQEGITDVYHVGDFGLYSDRDGVKFLRAVDKQLKLYGMRIFVTEGNHENYKFINSFPVEEDGMKHIKDNIFLLPRGFRWEIDGKTFVSLGGAASIDFTSRTVDKTWWKDEFITPEDLLKVAAGGSADIMITHEAPLGINALEKLKRDNKDGWEKVELEYAHASQKMMTLAVDTVRPLMLFHGHYHLGYEEDVLFIDDAGEGYMTAVYGMDMNRYQKNIGILDVENFAFEWVNYKRGKSV
jgi:hypothetical protein